jgi:hypothetical protein
VNGILLRKKINYFSRGLGCWLSIVTSLSILTIKLLQDELSVKRIQ